MTHHDDAGKLVLRVGLGIIMIIHGGLVISHDLPPGLAYLIYVGEIAAPVFLILGIYARVAAWIIVINMLIAMAIVRHQHLFAIGEFGGWALQVEGLLLVAAVSVGLLGPGRYSLRLLSADDAGRAPA